MVGLSPSEFGSRSEEGPEQEEGGDVQVKQVEWREIEAGILKLIELRTELRAKSGQRDALAEQLRCSVEVRERWQARQEARLLAQQHRQARQHELEDKKRQLTRERQELGGTLEALKNHVDTILGVGQILPSAYARLKEAERLLAGQAGRGRASSLLRSLARRRRRMVVQVAAVYPVGPVADGNVPQNRSQTQAQSAKPCPARGAHSQKTGNRHGSNVDGEGSGGFRAQNGDRKCGLANGPSSEVINGKEATRKGMTGQAEHEQRRQDHDGAHDISTDGRRGARAVIGDSNGIDDARGLGNSGRKEQAEPYIQRAGTLSIAGLALGSPEALLRRASGEKAEQQRCATALGYVAHALSLVAAYFDIPLRYPITPASSHSAIRDPSPPADASANGILPRGYAAADVTAARSGPRLVYPLCPEGQDQSRFAIAIFLLNKDVEQVVTSIGFECPDGAYTCLLAKLQHLLVAIRSGAYPVT